MKENIVACLFAYIAGFIITALVYIIVETEQNRSQIKDKRIETWQSFYDLGQKDCEEGLSRVIKQKDGVIILEEKK